ncbi:MULTISPECIES: antitoxin [Streptomyces]|uniref:antitoxin n=1 Tax=Streptomyces TaxID=1883 RepID=UPI0004CC3FE7|nr:MULTISPECIES: antitoxin [Streptomyces]RPK87493.1 hypothetical protein EES46_19425 [Streptomyces sp. ADI98-10]
MSAMDKIKNMFKGHEGHAGKGVNKAGDKVDHRTKGKHRGHVDTAQDKLRQRFGADRDQDGPPRT